MENFGMILQNYYIILSRRAVLMLKSFIENYRFTFILLSAIVIGGIAGVIYGPDAAVVKPLGELFLNLMFMIIVPLVFFSIASAIANMNGMKRLGKIMGSIVIIFLLTASVAAILGLIGASIIPPIEHADIASIKEVMSAGEEADSETQSLLGQLVATFTVPDFSLLMSRSNMLQLIVFSLLFGISTAMVGEKESQFQASSLGVRL